MIELKFRIWDKSRGCYSKSYDDCSVNAFNEFFIKPTNKLVFEQYTGVKDKNGKEVYEGDIVKMARSYGYRSLPKGALAKVVFDGEELCYKLKGRGEFRLTANKAVEVVGNIHESNMEELCLKE